jgi:hypothetical protein
MENTNNGIKKRQLDEHRWYKDGKRNKGKKLK